MAANIKWDDYQPTISNAFRIFRNDEYLHDVTLVSDDNQQFTAHELVLSASSEYFKNIFQQNSKHLHLVICVDGLSSHVLSKLLDFIYNGEVEILQANVEDFMDKAQRFKLNGVSLDDSDKGMVQTKTDNEQVFFFNEESNIIQDDFIFEDIKKEDVTCDDVKPELSIQDSKQPTESSENLSEICIRNTETLLIDAKTSTDSRLKTYKKSVPRTQDGKFKSHKSDKEVCIICDLTFNSKKEKLQHKTKIHKRDYLCSFCDFKSKNSEVIKEHERTHTGEKPLVCTWCGKDFRQKRTLQNHERLHTGEKPFQCKLCDSKFAQQTSLISHNKSHHKDASKKLETEASGTASMNFVQEKESLDKIIEDLRKLDDQILETPVDKGKDLVKNH